jgi:DNA (cytosine-5)-methyltransferase 1
VTVGVNSVNSNHFKVFAPAPPTPEELAEVNFERFAIGREWEKLAPGEGSDKYLNLSRSHPDLPSPTVTATAGHVAAAGVAHPLEPRKFTISELRRLCGFPDDFVLTGTYAQQWERLGRAVPPPMMAAVARELAVVLLAAGGR